MLADDMVILAGMIRELVMVRDGLLRLSGDYFAPADCSFVCRLVLFVFLYLYIFLFKTCVHNNNNNDDWHRAAPIVLIGLRLSDEATRIAVAHRLGCRACEPHVCVCGKTVDTRGLHGLACRRSASRQQRHSQMTDIIIIEGLKRAQIQAVKEPTGLVRSDGKRPDGATFIPWAKGKSMAWTSPYN